MNRKNTLLIPNCFFNG